MPALSPAEGEEEERGSCGGRGPGADEGEGDVLHPEGDVEVDLQVVEQQLERPPGGPQGTGGGGRRGAMPLHSSGL